MIPINETTATGEVTTLSGAVANLVAAVVTVTTDTGYTAATNADGQPNTNDDGEFSVSFVAPTNTPEIEITGPTNNINEGDSISYTITANSPTNVDLTIPVAIADSSNRTGDFVDEGTIYIRLPATLTTITRAVPTNQDDVDEDDGVVIATIQADSNYTIKANAGTVSVDVLDNDGTTPQSITVSGNSPVVEGSSVVFTLSRPMGSDTTVAIEVGYVITATGSYTNSAVGDGSETIQIGDESVDVTITTTGDLTADLADDAGLVLRIRSAKEFEMADYRVGDPASASVIVRDAPREMTIVANETGFGENETGGAKFTVTAAGLNSDKSFILNYNVSAELGNFIDTAGTYANQQRTPTNFTDPDGDNIYTGEISITLINDDDKEATGEIRVTLTSDHLSPNTYTLGRSLEITDTTLIYDDDAPELSIESAGDVGESPDALNPTMAVFNVTAPANKNDSITVNYRLEESTGVGVGDFIADGNQGEQTAPLDFSSNKNSATLSIPIVSDDDPEGVSTVTVTLLDEGTPGTTYYVNSANSSDSLEVSDDDEKPTISIAGGSAINEGQDAVFTVSTDELHTARTSPIVVNLTTSYTGTKLYFRYNRVQLYQFQEGQLLRDTLYLLQMME